MAPTEILARQHLEGLRPLAETAGVVVEILTGRDKGKERTQKLAALERGDIHILVGTHAVFQSDVVFRDLRLAIVDEQHRFGVRQRLELAEKGQGVWPSVSHIVQPCIPPAFSPGVKAFNRQGPKDRCGFLCISRVRT